MTSVTQIRAQFPMYDDLSDADLLMGLHRKFYGDMHVKDFVSSIDGADIAMGKDKTEATREYWRKNVQRPMGGESAEDAQRRSVGSADGAVGDPGGTLWSGLRGAQQGLTFGFGDEITAGVTSALTDQTYDEALKRERDLLELSREQNPGMTTGAEIAGAVVAPAAVLKGGAGLLGNSLRAGAVGAGEGFTYGFGSGEGGFDSRVNEGVETAKWGGGFGLAAPTVGRIAKRVYDRAKMNAAIKRAAKDGLSLGDLKKVAYDIFDKADNVRGLDRSVLTSATPGMADDAVRRGMDEVLTPQSHRALERIEDAATNPSPEIGFRELDILRRQAQIPAGNTGNRVEKAIGANLVEGVDDVISKASPALGDEVAEARKIWGRLRRSEIIQEAFSKAQNQASGFENGLRVQLRSILNNPKKRAGFSSEEIGLMEDIVQGTFLSNTLKKLGKFGIGQGQQSNGLLSLLGFGVAGPVAPIAGTVAQKGAELSTSRNAGLLQGLVSSGGPKNVPQLSGEARGLLEAIARSGGRVPEAID